MIVAHAEAERIARQGLVVRVDREVRERRLQRAGGVEQAGFEGRVARARHRDLGDLAAAEVQLEVGRADELGGPAERPLVARVRARRELIAEQALERELVDRGRRRGG